jgi:hypothetical protein
MLFIVFDQKSRYIDKHTYFYNIFPEKRFLKQDKPLTAVDTVILKTVSQQDLQ